MALLAPKTDVLLAVQDLYRMRCIDDFETDLPDCGTRLSLEELEGQAPVFANDRALFDYLRAAHAFFVRHAPDDARAFADALRRVLTNQPLRAKLSDAAWRHGQALPEWTDTAAAVAGALSQAMEAAA